MPLEVMDRRAADNEYLHRDVHGALSSARIYLEEHFGAEGLRDYLRRFALSYYAPLREDIRERGLIAIADRLRAIYDLEGADYSLQMGADELLVEVRACPAVAHMRASGYAVAPQWRETVRTVHEAICEGSPWGFELLEYCEETGANRQRFFRRSDAQ